MAIEWIKSNGFIELDDTARFAAVQELARLPLILSDLVLFIRQTEEGTIWCGKIVGWSLSDECEDNEEYPIDPIFDLHVDVESQDKEECKRKLVFLVLTRLEEFMHELKTLK